jgi:hypothetical protein
MVKLKISGFDLITLPLFTIGIGKEYSNKINI